MPSLQDRLATEFFEFDFFQAVRVLERIHSDRVPIGLDGPPAQEIARFRAHLSLSFPPSQIVALEPASDERTSPLLTVTFMGLYGPSGVLPTHYTQLLLDLVRDVRGPERRSLRDWLDLFDHRFISLFYRAWEKYRFHIAYDRGDAFRARPDSFTLAIQSLMGLGTSGHQNRLVIQRAGAAERPSEWDSQTESVRRNRVRAQKPELRKEQSDRGRIDDLALLHYAGLFVQRPRNTVNLTTLLSNYFQLPVTVMQFQGCWLTIPEEGQTRMGLFGTLGVNAMAGERTWNVQSRFRLRIGPLSFSQFEELLPDTAACLERKTFFLVAQLARLFVGPEFDFDIQLVLSGPEVPETKLDDSSDAAPRLGWTSWLISDHPAEAVGDAVFEAEWVTRL